MLRLLFWMLAEAQSARAAMTATGWPARQWGRSQRAGVAVRAAPEPGDVCL
ncbi:hypothetical protein J2732_005442 [Achromobacter deleyi]|jgi:hypothetical protein|nr:hypothetical protein [Achromobacter deleyi]